MEKYTLAQHQILIWLGNNFEESCLDFVAYPGATTLHVIDEKGQKLELGTDLQGRFYNARTGLDYVVTHPPIRYVSQLEVVRSPEQQAIIAWLHNTFEYGAIRPKPIKGGTDVLITDKLGVEMVIGTDLNGRFYNAESGIVFEEPAEKIHYILHLKYNVTTRRKR